MPLCLNARNVFLQKSPQLWRQHTELPCSPLLICTVADVLKEIIVVCCYLGSFHDSRLRQIGLNARVQVCWLAKGNSVRKNRSFLHRHSAMQSKKGHSLYAQPQTIRLALTVSWQTFYVPCRYASIGWKAVMGFTLFQAVCTGVVYAVTWIPVRSRSFCIFYKHPLDSMAHLPKGLEGLSLQHRCRIVLPSCQSSTL